MLHRSFKPAKCKTALKLAVSRIKLLKNKREAQVRQLKRELAQLLESGQDQTAIIRIEHVVREEKTMAAYDLVEVYCELIAARLPMIESQKNCPIDLKEAISSVIFASPRCSDIPELIDVRKHITAKYGKEFISAAVELRPDCGVNRLLVEKLSVKAPDGPTKMKLLTKIAEEHNVKWEPKSFGETDTKPSQDSQVGPNTYEKATYVEAPQAHVPPVRDEKGPPNLHPSSQYKMQDGPANLAENASFAVKNVGGNKPATSSRTNTEIRSSDSYDENRKDIPKGRQGWNMEFTDAASAAQAAAESAERASLAARAAAELSNREKITRQYSSGSQSSSRNGSRDEVPQEFAFHEDKRTQAEHAGMASRVAAGQSNGEKTTRQYSTGSQSSTKSNEAPEEYPIFPGEKQNSTFSANSTFHSSSSGLPNEQVNARDQDRPVREPDEYYWNSHENVAVKHPQLTNLTSSSSFNDVNPFSMDSKMGDIYTQNVSLDQENSDYIHEVSMEKQAKGTEADFPSHLHGDGNIENIDHFGDGRMDRQSSKASSSTHFITPSDDRNDIFKFNDPMVGSSTAGDLFVTDEANTQTNFAETNSYNDTAVIFDDSASEDDDYKFVDKTNVEQGSVSFFSDPGSKSQIDPLANSNAWSPGQVAEEKERGFSSQSYFSEVSESLSKSSVPSEKEDCLPVTFDDSDGPSSEGEVDLVKPKVSESYGHGNSVPDQSENYGAFRSLPKYDNNVDSDKKFGLSSSLDVSDNVDEHTKKMDISNVSEQDLDHDDLPTSKPSSRRSSTSGSNLRTNVHASQSHDTFNETETLEESHIESGKQLSYDTLKGGLRHKGFRRPPYLKSSVGNVPSSVGDISPQNEQTLPTARTHKSNYARSNDTYVSKVSRENRGTSLREHNRSSDSDSHDLVLNSQENMTSNQEPHFQKEMNKKSGSRATITYFDSDSNSEDEAPKQNPVSLARPISGISRRTTVSPKSGSGVSSKDASVTSGAGLGWKSSRVSNESESQKISSSRIKTSQDGLAEQTASKPVSESKRSSQEVNKSSARVQPSSPITKTVTPDNVETSRSSNTAGDASSKEKASHVHPKLPDYDSFAAHFLSLKKGHQ